MAKRERLEEGSFAHARCEKCVMTKPPIRHYLDDGLEAIDNHWTCGSSMTQFSVGLMGHHNLLKKLSDIERACTAHSNLHIHSWSYLTPTKERKVRSIEKIDDAERIASAYNEAMAYIVIGAFERREEWHRRKP